MNRDKYRCQLCGLPGTKSDPLSVDHKVPKIKGGTDDESNLWAIHRSMNSAKREGNVSGVCRALSEHGISQAPHERQAPRRVVTPQVAGTTNESIAAQSAPIVIA